VKHYLTISGGGPAITYLGGKVQKVQEESEIIGYAGASAGFILAAAGAFVIPANDVLTCLKRVFSSNVIRLDVDSFGRGGLIDWDFLGDEVDRMLGKGAKMGDAKHALIACVTNLDTRSPFYISKLEHPHVLVREVCQATSSFMCGVTPAAQIPSLGTKLSPDIRLFADGGFTDNTCDDVFDHKKNPRIALRLKPDYTISRVREWELAKIHQAVILSSLYASSQWKSKRKDGLNVDVNGVNDWRFNKDPRRVEYEWEIGYSTR
jgi:predicted acylesterase/phospholipase RssA